MTTRLVPVSTGVMTLHGDTGLPLTWCRRHFEFHGIKLADHAGVLVVIDDRARPDPH